MGNSAKELDCGYICPVRGCDKKKNRRFSLLGLCMHIRDYHGDEELQKRLRAKWRSVGFQD